MKVNNLARIKIQEIEQSNKEIRQSIKQLQARLRYNAWAKKIWKDELKNK